MWVSLNRQGGWVQSSLIIDMYTFVLWIRPGGRPEVLCVLQEALCQHDSGQAEGEVCRLQGLLLCAHTCKRLVRWVVGSGRHERDSSGKGRHERVSLGNGRHH